MPARSADSRVCPRCRLVQAAATACRSCGGEAPVPLHAIARSDQGLQPGRRALDHRFGLLGSLLGFLFGMGCWIGSTLLCMRLSACAHLHPERSALGMVLASLPGLAALFLVLRFAPVRRARPLTLTSAPDLHGQRAPAGQRVVGAARALDATVTPHLAGAWPPALASQLSIVEPSRPRQLYLRVIQARPFLVEDAADPLLVVGELLLLGEAEQEVLADETLLRAMGLQEACEVEGRACEVVLRADQTVEVSGEPSREVVPGLARGYRDEAARVLRGVPGAPIVVRLRLPP